jgi:hypothetical protein
MNDTRTTHPQDLREAVASLVSMLLGLLRAHGLRGLIHLPAIWLLSRQLRRMAEEFCELFAAWKAGTLPPVPAPTPWPDLQPLQAAPAQPVTTPRPAARPAARSPRRRPSQTAPAISARPQLAYAGVHARPYSTPNPQNLPGPASGILVTGRST